MSDLEARVARLERAVQIGHNLDLNEFNDADQAAAKHKQDAADEKAQAKQAADAGKE